MIITYLLLLLLNLTMILIFQHYYLSIIYLILLVYEVKYLFLFIKFIFNSSHFEKYCSLRSFLINCRFRKKNCFKLLVVLTI
jgi:hypothetical protein